MKTMLLNALVSLLIAVVSIAAYDRLVRRPAAQVGVIDVSEVYRIKEKEFTEMVTKPGASQVEKDKALQVAESFARALPQALEELPQECNCLVVVRTAIAAYPPNAIDMTPTLKRKLGLL